MDRVARQVIKSPTTHQFEDHAEKVIGSSTIHQFDDHAEKVIAVIGFGDVSVKF